MTSQAFDVLEVPPPQLDFVHLVCTTCHPSPAPGVPALCGELLVEGAVEDTTVSYAACPACVAVATAGPCTGCGSD